MEVEKYTTEDIDIVSENLTMLENASTVEDDEQVEVEKLTINDIKGTDVVQLLQKKDFNPSKFMNEMADNTKKALALLLAIQSNDMPLKKGGVGVSYLCDSVIMAVRKNFDNNEMVLFDILSAYVSSKPHDKSYTIHINEIEDFFDYSNKYYIRKIVNKAAETAGGKMMTFQVPMPSGKKKNMDVNWANALMYTPVSEMEENEDDPTISFIPSEIFRMLTISAGITHGSFHQLKISSKFVGYTKMMYYKLESMKDFTEYPGATPGIFKWGLEEMESYFDYPASYRVQDVKIRILDKARNDFEGTEGIDFEFSFEPYKKGRKIEGFTIHIIKKSTRKLEAVTVERKQIPASDDNVVMEILGGAGLSDDESRTVLKKYNENKRNIAFLSKAIVSVAQSRNIQSKTAVLCHIMDTGNVFDTAKSKESVSKNKFNNFTQRDYDFGDIEKKLAEKNKKQ